MLSSTKASARDNARLVIDLVHKLRQQKHWQLKNARIVIAPESNMGGYAQGIFDKMCDAKVPEFLMVSVDSGGDMPGIRTHEANKMQMGEAFAYMTDRQLVRVWDKFQTSGVSNKEGDPNLWRQFVDECSTFMEYTEPPKTENGKSRTYLTGKRQGGQDDLVMCALLYTALAKYFTSNMDMFLRSNNEYNRTSIKTEERSYDQVSDMIRRMRGMSHIPMHSLLFHTQSREWK